jgi:putative redox protein
MSVKAVWQNKMAFTATGAAGFTLPIDTSVEQGGDNSGFRPMELLLIGLAGCTGLDVISILGKKRQQVTHFEVRVSGERATEHPQIYTDLLVEYVISGVNIDPAAVARAVELSETKYCSANAMLSKAAKISRRILINEEEKVKTE